MHVTGGLLGGRFDVNMSIESKITRQSQVKFKFDDINLKPIKVNNFFKFEGLLSGSGDMGVMTSNDDGTPTRLNLSGEGNVSGVANISAMPMDQLVKLANFKRLNDFIKTNFSGDSLPLNGRWTLSDNSLYVEDVSLKSTQARAVLNGSLSLPKMEVEASLSIFDRHPDAFFMMEVTGLAPEPDLKATGRWLSGK